ncbi:MAG: hypothetical protein A2293_04100 [Elusimicrobia bacterium RIFOXYB2_FULL_49_7]|nr:MAG: hypothetical protein A2293_04100 [Elusimicrobia bacterium RIFOXYB2_FULL_49_7]
MNKTLSERQKEIIKASFKLIAEEGIQGLTIKNLANRIGVVESAIYRHFENKTRILIALLDTIKAHSIPANSGEDVDSITRIEQRLINHFKTFSSYPALVSVVFAEDLFQNDKSLVDKTKEMMQKSITDMGTIIKNGQNQGEIRTDIDSEHFAIMINGTIRMLVKQWKMTGYSFDLIKKGDKLIRSMKIILKPAI